MVQLAELYARDIPGGLWRIEGIDPKCRYLLYSDQATHYVWMSCQASTFKKKPPIPPLRTETWLPV